MAEHLESIGQVVGEYRLRNWLGGGSFGDVYLAEHVRDGQQVAVKILQTRLSQQDDLRAFINEARTIRLRHPHIVPLLDFGIGQKEMPFLVMEYASKGTLRDRHPRGTRVPLPRIIEYVQQVAGALQYAHNQHLVHRDVKPENMLVRADGTVLLSDFGIAITLQSTHSFASQREMAGTASYMAPEQMEGKPRTATDQYALAVVVYEWIAGRTPFQGSPVEVVMQHATQPPPSLVARVPGITREIEAVLFKALAKDYKERFPSIQEFATALQQAIAPGALYTIPTVQQAWTQYPEMPPPPPPPSPPLYIHAQQQPAPLAVHSEGTVEVTPSRGKLSVMPAPYAGGQQAVPQRKRGLLVLVTLAALLLIVGGYAYTVVSNMQARTAAQQAAATVTSKATATGLANVTATATVQRAYDAYVAQHGVAFGFDTAHTHNNPYEYKVNETNLAELHLAWSGSTHSATQQPALYSSPIMANGVVYIGSIDGNLYAFDAATGQQKWIRSIGNLIPSTPTVAHGLIYVGAYDNKLYAFDAATGQKKWAATTGGFIVSSPIVVNGLVYAGSFDHKLYAFDATTGEQKWAVATGGNIFPSPAAADGMIYIGSDDTKLYAFDAMTGQKKWAAATNSIIDSSPAIANGIVYVGSNDNKLYAFDATTGQQKWSATTESAVASSPAVANGMVYVGSYDGKLYAFDAVTGGHKWVAPTGAGILSSPTVANGLIYIGSTDSKLYAFDSNTGEQQWSTQTGGSITTTPAVADGIIYVSSTDGKLYAFSLA